MSAELTGVLHLRERCSLGHDDGGRYAQPPGMIGDPLRMIARRHGNDTTLALIEVKRQQLVEGAALLEGRCELQVFEFEEDLGAGQSRQRARMPGWRDLDCARNRARGALDIGKSNGKGRIHAGLARGSVEE